jgi:tryptophan 7-halogenase
MSEFKFTVVGSGTSGWLTALYLQKYYPFITTQVISSSDIGILGAGEGTTPDVLFLLEKLGISIQSLIKHTDATVKNGIKFTNWNGDGDSYFHGFVNNGNFNPFYIKGPTRNGLPILALEQIVLGNNIDDIFIDKKMSEKCQVKYVTNMSIDNKLDDALYHFNRIGTHAFHFNAAKLANFLKEVAVERGIKYIDDEVVDFKLDEEEYIKAVITKSGKEYQSSFVFDCSGFNKLIIGGLYKSEWISYSDNLPIKRAIGFFLDLDDGEIPTYTESIAMDCGWAWKIPVQTRFGCGYAFDSDYITDEDAKKEIIAKFGPNVTFGKTFEFNAGMFKTPWVKNCVAIGLSAGFIEPLEATSIMLQVLSLDTYLDNNIGTINRDQYYINRYNERIKKINDENKDFIYAHYLTEKNDTPFWKEFREKNKMPERVKEFEELCKITMPDETFIMSKGSQVLYGMQSWYCILAGVRFFNKDIALECGDAMLSDFRREEINHHKTKYKINMILNEDVFIKHNYFIDYMLNINA